MVEKYYCFKDILTTERMRRGLINSDGTATDTTVVAELM
jgi:hypothetical protein